MKKSQVGIEFIAIVGIATMIILFLIGGVYYLTYNYSDEKIFEKISDLGYSIQNELILAEEVEIGYERVIFIPFDINGAEYSLSQNDKDLIISYKGSQQTFLIPAVTGTLIKGDNTITKNTNQEVIIS